MKMNGVKLDVRAVEYTVIPRASGNIVFKSQAVPELDAYDEKFPAPVAPTRTIKGGTTMVVTDDPEYMKALTDWATNKSDWMFIMSLSATEWLEWERVDLNNPATFKEWRAELKEAGFTVAELIRIVNDVQAANGMNQKRIDEAQADFLAGLREDQKLPSSPNFGLLGMQNGEPANDSDSGQKE